MRHPSLYLDWYVHVPHVKYDFRSSGIAYFKHGLDLGEVDLGMNYVTGNPDAVRQIAQWFNVKSENVFISSEGATGQNSRLIRLVAERSPNKNEAIVEYPTYEPLLRATQEHFPVVRRVERREKEDYTIDVDRIRKIASAKTGLLVLTNPHAPTGTISSPSELKQLMNVAHEFGFYVLCDEIYAEFDRTVVPPLFHTDSELGVVTTSFTKAYGLGGLKLGVALMRKELVDSAYIDVLNTVGNSPNVVQLVAIQLLSKHWRKLDEHRRKWDRLRKFTEAWLHEQGIEHCRSRLGVTYWIKLPIEDTYEWTNQRAIPRYQLAPVPGTFFLFKDAGRFEKSSMIRLGLGNIDPETADLREGLDAFRTALQK